jgi:Raf kinase inhibitor-like YbhB/YbcL family protein
MTTASAATRRTTCSTTSSWGRPIVAAAAALALADAAAAAPTLLVRSTAFRTGGPIPKAYTCDGRNVSPPLRWTALPHCTRSLALRMFDADAGFTHWTAWGISPASHGLAAGRRPPAQGRNDFGRTGYGGPCPPPGIRHHYVFTLYALAAPLPLRPGASPRSFSTALGRIRVLARTLLVGTYER